MKEKAEKLLVKMKTFDYGWIDKTGYKYINRIAKNKFLTDYYLQTPTEVEKNKIGICWDQVEYQRKYFVTNKIPHKTIFVLYDDGIKYPNHTFLIFKDNKNYYWFENTYNDVKGILEFKNLQDCLEKVKKEFMKENKLDQVGEKLFWYVYEKPKSGLGAIDFINYCRSGIKADADLKNIDTW